MSLLLCMCPVDRDMLSLSLSLPRPIMRRWQGHSVFPSRRWRRGEVVLRRPVGLDTKPDREGHSSA